MNKIGFADIFHTMHLDLINLHVRNNTGNQFIVSARIQVHHDEVLLLLSTVLIACRLHIFYGKQSLSIYIPRMLVQ